MNPYTVLGVAKDADAKAIKAAYRKLSGTTHPDKEGGSQVAFQEVALAYEVLSKPDRRERYDKLGRTDESRVTPARVKLFIQETMRTVILAARADGSTDDPRRENIRDKMLLGVLGARVTLKAQIDKLNRQIDRAEILSSSFELTEGEFDPVREAISEEREKLVDERTKAEDALELSSEVERLLKIYRYKVDPRAEGQFTREPTTRRGGSVLLGYDQGGRPNYTHMRSSDD